jgi:hypothetical protein
MKNKLCAGPECDRKPVAKGLCYAHYHQTRQGKPLTPLRAYKVRPEAPEGYAFCNMCEAFKRVDEFWLRANGAPRPYCKGCHNLYQKEEAA